MTKELTALIKDNDCCSAYIFYDVRNTVMINRENSYDSLVNRGICGFCRNIEIYKSNADYFALSNSTMNSGNEVRCIKDWTAKFPQVNFNTLLIKNKI